MNFLRVAALILAVMLAGCGDPPITPAQAVDKFFENCGQAKYADAYASTTVPFRVEKSAKYFEARVRDLKFDKVSNFQWQEPQVNGDIAKRWGEITTPDTKKPMTIIVTMHRDGKSWRLHEVTMVEDKARHDLFADIARSIDMIDAATRSFTEAVDREVPTERLIRILVEKTLLDFNAAIKAGNFDEFFKTISDRWKYRGMTQRELELDLANLRNRISVTQLNHAFKGFIDARVDISAVKDAEMKLNEPARITSDGVLLVEGYFTTSPTRVLFKLEYFFEGGRWRLFGLSVDLKPAGK